MNHSPLFALHSVRGEGPCLLDLRGPELRSPVQDGARQEEG